MPAPGVAGEESLEGEPATFKRAVLFDGFEPIGTTGGGKAALGAKERRYSPLVKADNGGEQYDE